MQQMVLILQIPITVLFRQEQILHTSLPSTQKKPTLEQCRIGKYNNGIPFKQQITPKILSELQNINQQTIAIT